MNPPNYARGVFFTLITTALWGVLPIFMKIALEDFSSGTIVWFRFTFAFVVLFSYLSLRQSDPGSILRNPPGLCLLGGLCLGGNYFYFIRGVELSSPSNAAVLIQVAPVLLVMVGVLMFAEKFKKAQFTGLLVAVAGMILFYKDQRMNVVDTELYTTANLYIFVGAVLWVGYMAFQKKLTPAYKTQHLNLLVYGTAAVALLGTVNWVEFKSVGMSGWGMLIFLGINTLVAYGSLAEAIKCIPVSLISVIVTLNPFITLTAMHILAQSGADWITPETIGLWGYVGACTAISGVILVLRKS